MSEGLPSYVYRLYDVKGHLLYVGISTDPNNRLIDHRSKQPWGSEIQHMQVDSPTDRLSAEVEEMRQIYALHPIYNLNRTLAKHRPKKSAAKAVFVRLPQSYIEALDDEARTRDVPVAEVIRVAIAKDLGLPHISMERWPKTDKAGRDT